MGRAGSSSVRQIFCIDIEKSQEQTLISAPLHNQGWRVRLVLSHRRMWPLGNRSTSRLANSRNSINHLTPALRSLADSKRMSIIAKGRDLAEASRITFRDNEIVQRDPQFRHTLSALSCTGTSQLRYRKAGVDRVLTCITSM